MLGTILTVCGIGWAIKAFGEQEDNGDTVVKRGSTFFGSRYKDVTGTCFRCDGTGTIHGRTCRKCGGTGRYSHRTWYR